MKKIILIAFLCLLPVLAMAKAKDGPTGVKLSAHDTADIARMETYLNSLKSVSADFMQIDDDGGILRGTIAIQRPGKMRVNYDPPSKDFIIADGNNVHIWNNDLQEQTNVDEGSSLAEFILRDPIKFSGDVVITKFKRLPAKLELTLVQTNDAGAGQLTLVFEDNPLKLRQWKVTDTQGRTTGVNLENMQYDVIFPPRLFYYTPPNFGQNKGSQAP